MVFTELETYYLIVSYVLAGALGLCVGSFLNVVIYRVPLGMSIAFPASHCPKCNEKIKWYDNIPVLSYIILGAKCRKCKEPISFRYTAVEIANTVLWLLCVKQFVQYNVLYCIAAMLASTVMICVFFIDLEHKIILDRFQIIFAVLAVIAIAGEYIVNKNVFNLLSHVVAGAIAFLSFLLIAVVGEKIAKREALGGGDIKLFAIIGLFLGLKKLLLAILVASVSATILLTFIKLFSKSEEREFPFAPFLSSGFVFAMLFGDGIINWYLNTLIF